jgi:integrase
MIRPHTAKDGTTTYGVRVNVGGKKLWVGTFSTRKAARDAEAIAVLKADKQPRPTVDRFYDDFMAAYQRKNKQSSVETAQAALRKFVDDFGHRTLNSITDTEALKWANGNEWRVNAVITLMAAAVRKGHLDRSPFSGLGTKGKGRVDLDPLTPEEVERLAGCSKSLEEYAPTMKALILFAAYTGMRESELFGLEWRDIDFEQGRIRVERQWRGGRFSSPKSGKRRLISLLPQARDALLPLGREKDEAVPTPI